MDQEAQINQTTLKQAKILAEIKKRTVLKYGSLNTGAEAYGVSSALLSLVFNGKRALTIELKRKIISCGVATPEMFSDFYFEDLKKARTSNEQVFIIEKLNETILHQEYLLKLHKDIVERVYRENENLHSELVKALKLINKLKNTQSELNSE